MVFFNILLTSTFDCVGVDAFSHGGLYDVVEEFACSEGVDITVFIESSVAAVTAAASSRTSLGTV